MGIITTAVATENCSSLSWSPTFTQDKIKRRGHSRTSPPERFSFRAVRTVLGGGTLNRASTPDTVLREDDNTSSISKMGTVMACAATGGTVGTGGTLTGKKSTVCLVENSAKKTSRPSQFPSTAAAVAVTNLPPTKIVLSATTTTLGRSASTILRFNSPLCTLET